MQRGFGLSDVLGQLLSVFVDLDHLEANLLARFAFVFHSEDHDFVARQAVAEFFRHLEHQSGQFVPHLAYELKEILGEQNANTLKITYSDRLAPCIQLHHEPCSLDVRR